MDLEAIKVLLDAQNKTFKTAIDIVVNQLNSRIQKAEETAAEVIKSLEFTQTEVKELQCEVKKLRQSEVDKTKAVDNLKQQLDELEKRVNYQEDYSRRKNLRFTGIEEQSSGETWEETAKNITKMMEEKLQIPGVTLERAHRTGSVTHSRPRTVIARFAKYSDREAVIRNARKLKGTGIYINEDLCPASQEIKNSQIPLMKKAREEGKIAFFKQTRLIIKERGDPTGGDVTGLRAAGAGDGAGPAVVSHGGAVRAGDLKERDEPSCAASAAISAVHREPAAPLASAVGGSRTSSPGGAGVRSSANSPGRRQQHRPLRNRNR